ncbi:MAG: LamG domain-containing protein, partial [Bryobacteraceae bacterium]
SGAAAILGTGAALDGSANAYMDMGTSSTLDLSGAFTLSAWFKKTAYTGNYEVLMSKCSVPACNYELALDGPNHDLEGIQNGTVVESGVVPALNQWHHAVETSDGTHLYFYLDGVLVHTAAAGTGNTIPGTHFDLGREQLSGENLSGIVNEARLSKIARSAGWIATEYSNQNNPSGFYNLSAEQ